MDSSVPLMCCDPDRSWITDRDPDHPRGMHLKITLLVYIGQWDIMNLKTEFLISIVYNKQKV